MATQASRNLAKQDLHSVGNLVSTRKHIMDFANGGLYVEDVDNFHLVQGELSATSGEMEVKYLTDATHPKEMTFLSAGSEYHNLPFETIESFFNGKGDKERIVYLTQGLIFDTSAFEPDTGIAPEDIKAGHFAHYDPTKKAFLIHDGAHADYATASVKFMVRRELQPFFSKSVVRLIVI